MTVKGNTVDDETRCVHYHSAIDIIAIKMKCCNTYYSCIYCHEAAAGHVPQQWRKHEFDTLAILCGSCREEMTINTYLESNYSCPSCNAAFNPGCSNHNHFYFETSSTQ
jgi:uncharacterized CHY-type Zn-finger protein